MQSRRQFINTAVLGTVAGATETSFACNAGEDQKRHSSDGTATYPPKPQTGRLHDLWSSEVKDLVLLPVPALSDGEKERHTLYSVLLMALVAHYWNGNKNGLDGDYPWRAKQKRPDGQYLGGDYLGHNIACLAVDGQGEVIDFDFNHNNLLNSSVEHAESRLIRRIFSLTQLYDGWAVRKPPTDQKPRPYSTILDQVTVYTSLESCSQCSGIMALGSVKEVVYLQRDPGQSSIGNILRNLSAQGGASFAAPLPVPADAFSLECFGELEKGYSEFSKEVTSKPFHIDRDGKKDTSASITSFLCTDRALEVFKEGQRRVVGLQVKFPGFKPKTPDGKDDSRVLSNQEVVDHIQRFFAYATRDGRRGTPHKL